MKRPRNLTPAQKAAQRKATLASPWRGQRMVNTAHAKALEAAWMARLSRRWGPT
jgi:hypothetical protein